LEKKFQKKSIVERKLFNRQDFFGRIWAHYSHLKKFEIAIFTHNLKNHSGQWEGPGGGELNGCIVHQVHTSIIKFDTSLGVLHCR
jgi:hypothetical protein